VLNGLFLVTTREFRAGVRFVDFLLLDTVLVLVTTLSSKKRRRLTFPGAKKHHP
jgi:hypothetical protein